MTALHEGFWLSGLTAEDLNNITAEHFDQSLYYASSEHNLSGFFPWEQELLDQHFRRGSSILVAGAGGGREVLALRKAGFGAEGFECSLPLVRASEKVFDQVGEPNYVTHCPLGSVPPATPTHDGLIVGWSAYTHIPTKRSRIFFLQALRQRALPHSPVLISFFTRRRCSRDEALVYRIATFCRLFLRGRKDRPELGDHLSFGRYVHMFTRDEVEEELRTAGFRVAHYNEVGDSGHAIGVAE